MQEGATTPHAFWADSGHSQACAGAAQGKNPGWKDREGDVTSGRAVRLVRAGASPCSAPRVPRRLGLRNVHAPVAFRAAYVVWVESTYVRYTHIYVCVRIYIHRHI